ncbi:MAG: hypothetical protein AB1468_06240 [Candidatus Micrarchaeota archaeon]
MNSGFEMKIYFSEKARDDFSGMDKQTRKIFWAHINKFSSIPPRKHLRFGIPFFVEKVGKQGRVVFSFDKDELIVIRCFTTHKQYEKWYNSFR